MKPYHYVIRKRGKNTRYESMNGYTGNVQMASLYDKKPYCANDEYPVRVNVIVTEASGDNVSERKCNAIDFLRKDEGESVTIMCDNPDFNGHPDRAVECRGEWTDWEDKRFGGKTLVEALENAAIARRKKEG